jgi:hypothetical protein
MRPRAAWMLIEFDPPGPCREVIVSFGATFRILLVRVPESRMMEATTCKLRVFYRPHEGGGCRKRGRKPLAAS